jgi:protein tyrosine/serine phosphatase
MSVLTRALLITALLLVVAVAPVAVYRYEYTTHKRLREVTPGKVWRSGQMTARGFSDAVARHGIRTVINLQNEFPDPDLRLDFLNAATMKESELCRRLGVRYVALAPDLVPRPEADERRPEVIDRFLDLMDDPDTYPVLIHCRAGLHRTGCLVAVYRMEYEGYSRRRAFLELKSNGFGERAASVANDYVAQYVLNYEPGFRRGEFVGLVERWADEVAERPACCP